MTLLGQCQWVSGFLAVIKEENDGNIKSAMLDYMSDLNAQDFGWSQAKASHAVLLCCTEEGKVTWLETVKID